MEFPIRCFSCGSVVGHLYGTYMELTKTKPKDEALDDLGVRRYCCRRMFLSHVDLISQVTRYPRI
jgi:DNA-directed RNA polymerase subunit N (RpoN/RPB10)